MSNSKNKFFTLLLSLIGLVVLSGCSMKGQVESPMWHKNAPRSEIIAHFSEQCRSYGFQEDTPEFSNCLMETEGASRANAQARMRDVFNNIQNNRPKNCTTTVTGTTGIYTGNTTCY